MEIAPIGPCRFPVIDVEPQSDVEGFRAQLSPDVEYVNPGGAWVRRDDAHKADDRYRLYEIAGAPHVARMRSLDREYGREGALGDPVVACCDRVATSGRLSDDHAVEWVLVVPGELASESSVC
jgi:hypothetical protein